MLEGCADTLQRWSVDSQGSYIFLPANADKFSHMEVTRHLLSEQLDVGVLVINGDAKTLYFNTPASTPITYTDADLMSILQDARRRACEKQLNALIVTGNLCLGRGVTLQVTSAVCPAHLCPEEHHLSA